MSETGMPEVHYDVVKPNPDAPATGRGASFRKQGTVRAIAGETQVGQLTFAPDEDRGAVETVKFDVDPSWRRQGIATALYDELSRTYDHLEVVESSGSNDEDGDKLLAALRASGRRYHGPGCYRQGAGCCCHLASLES